MAKMKSWLRDTFKFLIFGLALGLGIKLLFKPSLARAFEYAGAGFFLISLIVFLTTGPKQKDKLPHSDIYYVLSFGFVGFVLLLLPLLL